jgi:uncharacterized protein HemY
MGIIIVRLAVFIALFFILRKLFKYAAYGFLHYHKNKENKSQASAQSQDTFETTYQEVKKD